MKLTRRLLNRVLLPLLTLVLASVLVFLYLMSRSEGTQDYASARDLIAHAKQLDARWDTEILKARIAVARNYDPLIKPLVGMKTHLETFENLGLTQASSSSSAWKDRRATLEQALAEKSRLVEQFKSHNAVLRNSLAFLPTAEDDIQRQLSGLQDYDKLMLQATSNDIYDLLLSTLEFAQTTTDERANDILLGINQITVDQQRLPAAFKVPMDILLNHVQLILREQPLVNTLLDDIAAVPVSESLDAITDQLNQDQQIADHIDQQYHLYLLIFSALMAVLLLYMASRLARSYAQINQINRDLQTANEYLEQRVEERTRELREAQSELVDTARHAGMAEIATNVLHNVGNVLNSVNISADLVARKLRASKALGLGRAVGLMNEHADDLGEFLTHDAKGKLLPGYLNQLVEAIATEQQSMADELGQLGKSVDHIKDIVSTQQSYAGVSSLEEPLHIGELLEDALRMNSGALTRHNVTVVRDYEEVPQVMADKHRMLLILINLISNAKQAMSSLSDRARKLTLQVRIVEGSTLHISVKDDGEGILPENMTRIFAHGFTTRKDGHGFGLHSCALAAIEMNGHLTAHSDGPGKGAVFTLELPLKTAVGVP
ncbi:DAHL domain-containing protein [Pseudomonas gingeri]|uniref:histidine kinase n=2 Tax=Pseudomonas gingeri TaxID=117681 RepID=A0A7Y7YDH4_9PSED|nr:DAHL domain-containing protein [Pseudomonas gingeri]NWA01478.1 GHKL domain-containing protein [Pseudomonas gingeri]NWA13719.1 GHKL domain-containing protein [Pseudomonas gingeri]NWA52921.1 GHKL domain-containing protein [Pseudomonas gingeri]NWA96418.1 GHKL domain-containing protein [Pseudomonas gingeri]NWA99945.1 GHKL domain-containing protein [Pseudomonas gingeri]